MIEPVRMRADQRMQAAETLTQAFRADPMYAYICPNETERIQSLRRMWDALLRVALVYGEVWITPGASAAPDSGASVSGAAVSGAAVSGAAVSGASCWAAPGHTEMGIWQMLRTGLALPRAILRFQRDSRRRLLEVEGHLAELHRRALPGPHWYLWALGVAPADQGQGIGSSLLAPVLARADAGGLPCYLETETERNVRFYRRHNFEVITAQKPPGHDLLLWTMVRHPQPPAPVRLQ